MKYPQFCFACAKKSPSVKLLLCLQGLRFLSSLRIPACYFLSTEERSVLVSPRRTACNRTPHCRAAPQTTCPRSVVDGRGCEKATEPKKEEEKKEKKKKTQKFPSTKTGRACAQRGRGGVEEVEWCVRRCSQSQLRVSRAELALRGEERRGEECASTQAAERDVAAAAQLSCRCRRGRQPADRWRDEWDDWDLHGSSYFQTFSPQRNKQLNFSLVCLCWEGQRSTSPLNKRSALKSLYMQVNMPAF